ILMSSVQLQEMQVSIQLHLGNLFNLLLFKLYLTLTALPQLAAPAYKVAALWESIINVQSNC
ncbi:hypothetical protein Dimus_005440, partial [Dionaea muscipula]